MSQHAENLILHSAKYSDDSNDYVERHEMGANLMNGRNTSSPTQTYANGEGTPTPYEKPDHRLNNSPDILSMVLSLKKNALMHDPYVIEFISSIR